MHAATGGMFNRVDSLRSGGDAVAAPVGRDVSDGHVHEGHDVGASFGRAPPR